MPFAKKITLFLMDGSPEGRISCELSNWNGKAYRLPKSSIRECSDRPELDNPGVYILFGRSDTVDNEGLAYIGEADGIRKRLLQHVEQKDFWNDAIVFISKDSNLNKAHIKYIENSLYEAAREIGRYQLENSNTPTRPTISEPDTAEMEEFIAQIKLLIGTLGYKIFEPLISKKNPQQRETFYIQAVRGADGQGVKSADGFIVLKNSIMASSVIRSFTEKYQLLRDKLLTDKIVVPSEQGLRFTKDFLFSSPSTAASIIMGRCANGLSEWKTKDGRILKALDSE
ncbi:GIY-YIG nuclease family protein [Alistipes sp.]|uniref:GIY-YIG nuclease family protein n=1 Tax=Alistipes sp. TaxID=1872444 RepID=UPI003AEF5291